MKKIKAIVLMSLILTSFMAQAGSWWEQVGYDCTNYENKLSMKIQYNNGTRLNYVSVYLTQALGKTQFFKAYSDFNDHKGIGGKKESYKLFSEDLDSGSVLSTLTIVTLPKSCGRGSCDNDGGVTIRASLKIGKDETYFSCQKIEF